MLLTSKILNRKFNEIRPLKVLTMDTACIEVLGNRKFLYINAVKDVSNKKIIAYEISYKKDAEIVDKTLDKLLKLELN